MSAVWAKTGMRHHFEQQLTCTSFMACLEQISELAYNNVSDPRQRSKVFGTYRRNLYMQNVETLASILTRVREHRERVMFPARCDSSVRQAV